MWAYQVVGDEQGTLNAIAVLEDEVVAVGLAAEQPILIRLNASGAELGMRVFSAGPGASSFSAVAGGAGGELVVGGGGSFPGTFGSIDGFVGVVEGEAVAWATRVGTAEPDGVTAMAGPVAHALVSTGSQMSSLRLTAEGAVAADSRLQGGRLGDGGLAAGRGLLVAALNVVLDAGTTADGVVLSVLDLNGADCAGTTGAMMSAPVAFESEEPTGVTLQPIAVVTTPLVDATTVTSNPERTCPE